MVDVQDVHLTRVQPICHGGVAKGFGIAIVSTDVKLFQVAFLLILRFLGLAAILQSQAPQDGPNPPARKKSDGSRQLRAKIWNGPRGWHGKTSVWLPKGKFSL